MKRIIKSFVLAAAAVAALSSCQEKLTEKSPESGKTHRVSFVTDIDDVTKTTMEIEEGVARFSWIEADKNNIRVFENDVKCIVAPKDVKIGEDGKLSFSAEFETTNVPSYSYRAVIAAAFAESSEDPMVKASQNISGSSYCSDADILVARPILNQTTTQGTFSLKYTRPVAISKMTLKQLENGEVFKSLKVSSDKPIVKTLTLNKSTEEPFTWSETGTNAITITPEEGLETPIAADASGNLVISFITAPVEDATFTVFLTTNKHVYKKTFAKTISLNSAEVKAYNVNLSECGIDLFVESFDKNAGTGGNDGKWDNISASTDLLFDNDNWSSENGNGASKCARLGTSKNKGFAITPGISFENSGAYSLTFKAGAWTGDSNNLNVSIIDATSSEVLKTQAVTMENSAWTEYTIPIIIDESKKINIKFEAEVASKNRFFLDEVCVYKGADYKYFELHPEKVILDAEETSTTISVISNVSWSATAEEEDVTITPSSGTGDRSITISFPKNNTAKDITAAKVKFEGEGLINNFIVTQKANPKVIESKTVSQFIKLASEDTFYRLTGTVSDYDSSKTYTNFKLTDENGDGITVFGADKGEYTFANGDIVTLIGTYFLYNTTHEVVNAKIEKVQTVKKLEVSTNSITVKGEITTTSFTVNATQGVKWTAASDNENISITSGSTGTGNGKVDLEFPINKSGEDITATITVSTEEESVIGNPQEVSFIQKSLNVVKGSWTYVFANNPFGSANTSTTKTLESSEGKEMTWTGNYNDCGYVSFETNKGLHLGSGTQAPKAIFSTTEYGDPVNFINLRLYSSGTTGVAKVTVNGKDYLSEAQFIASTATDYLFVPGEDGVQTGKIEITLSDSAKKAIYFESMSINVQSCALVTSNVGPGEVESGTEVTLSCETEGSTIYYTTDGTDPTVSSAIYSSPIPITKSTTIKAFSAKTDYSNSDIVSFEYTVKTSGQTTKLTNANIVAAGDPNTGYREWTLKDGNKFDYSAYAIKNSHSKATSSYHFLQIKKYDNSLAYYIQLPTFSSTIKQIKMTVSSASNPMTGGGNTSTLFFSASNTTSAAGTGVVSATGASTVTIDASSLNLKTGYITSGGAVRIWDIEITY